MGAQRLRPRVREVADILGLKGPFALVTAGWQARESEDRELREHLDTHCFNLELHRRANDAFESDPELAAAHRARQEHLRFLQDVYRIRLRHAFDAELDVRAYPAPEDIREDIQRASIHAIRDLDEAHLAQNTEVWSEFERELRPADRPAIQKHRTEIEALLDRAEAVCIAGGHVAILLNRMTLFGLEDALREKPLLAWSAGAMSVMERIVLFHDDAPQGEVLREVLDAGLAAAPGIVAFPEPERRLRADRDRLSLAAQRFAPSRCVLLPASSYVLIDADGRSTSDGAQVVEADGGVTPFLWSQR
ncbi:MAG: hypothetical protein AAFZ18_22420 [Myxococcota bacterium]